MLDLLLFVTAWGIIHGEFASQSMIEKIEKWYDSEFKELLVQGVEINQLREQLDKLLVRAQ